MALSVSGSLMHPTITNVYVDCFNLYYGIRGPYKWVDVRSMCRILLSNSQISRIRGFTARVSSRPQDPSQHIRQQAYLRALQTNPGLSIHFGHFLASTPYMPGAPLRTSGPPAMVQVVKTEEKGSDVNLATDLLCGAFDRDYETAAVISNDSDLSTPIDVVRKRFRLDVVVINPHKTPSAELKRVATSIYDVHDSTLKRSQFPPRLHDAHGVITRPALWDECAWRRGINIARPAGDWLRNARACPNCSSITPGSTIADPLFESAAHRDHSMSPCPGCQQMIERPMKGTW